MKNFYSTNGYLIKSVFSEEECDKSVAIFKKYADTNYHGIMNLDRGGNIEYVYHHSEERENLNKIIEPKDAVYVRSLMLRNELVTIIETIQQAEMVALQSMFLFKHPGTKHGNFNTHQDNAYPQMEYGHYISISIAFSDQYPENGGLFFYPGTHKEPMLPVESNEKEGFGMGVVIPEKYKKKDLYIKKGDILVVHGNVVHGSYSNHSTHDRPTLLVAYGRKGSKFIPGSSAKRTPILLR